MSHFEFIFLVTHMLLYMNTHTRTHTNTNMGMFLGSCKSLISGFPAVLHPGIQHTVRKITFKELRHVTLPFKMLLYTLDLLQEAHTFLCGSQSFSLGTLTVDAAPLPSPSSTPGLAMSLCSGPLLLQVCSLLWLCLVQLYPTCENHLKHYHFWEAFLAKSQPPTNFCKQKARILWKKVLFWT